MNLAVSIILMLFAVLMLVKISLFNTKQNFALITFLLMLVTCVAFGVGFSNFLVLVGVIG